MPSFTRTVLRQVHWRAPSLLLIAIGVAGCWGSKAPPPETTSPTATETDVTEVAVDIHKPLQTLEGFGAAVAWYGDWYVSHPNREMLRSVLFQELGLDILRLRNQYRESGDPPDPAGLALYHDAELSLGHAPRVLLTSWSPPAALKANGATDCANQDPTCTLAKDSSGRFVYDAFGQYWADSIEAYRAEGLVPYYVSIQNEPDFTPGSAAWEACRFDATETAQRPGYDRAFDSVVAAFDSRGIEARFLGPETAQITSNRVENYLSELDKTRLYGIAHHLYDGEKWRSPSSYAPAMQAIAEQFPDLPRFQTEFSPTHSGASENAAAFEVAGLIHQSLASEGASAYLHWDLLWNENSGLVSLENPWKVASWTTAEGYIIRPNYFGMRHYSRYTDPGDQRIGTSVSTSTVWADTFLSPDEGRLTVVLLNNDSKSATVNLTAGGYSFTHSLRISSEDGEPWSTLDPPEQLPAQLALGPRSITTLVFSTTDLSKF